VILQALKEYYDRKAADPATQMAPLGWEWKEIPYVVVLNPDGSAAAIESTYEGEGRLRRAQRFLVPQAVKRTVCVAANLLWDNPEYALGVVLKGRPERVAEQHAAFRLAVEALALPDDDGIRALRAFLGVADRTAALARFGEAWTELAESGAFLSFRLLGESCLIAGRPAVRDAVNARTVQGSNGDVLPARCLVTGCLDVPLLLHPAIKGVSGANTTGGNIISFNLDAFRSHGKEQGANAPVGKVAAFAYTTALNHLLRRDSMQKLPVGDATTVFWAARETPLEQQIPDFFGEPPKEDPDRNVRAVASLLRAVLNGAFAPEDRENRFYVLGLAPNAARIAVRFWHVDTVAGMSVRIAQHFFDTQLVHGPKDRDHLSLKRLLKSVAAQEDEKHIPPNLAGDTMRAILEGLPYPETLLQAAVRRNRAEQNVPYARAALIRACINRRARYTNPDVKEELTVSLDPANSNTGYRLGRLFAVLEKIQAEASPGINATIRDRYYGAASGTPVTVFSTLMKLKNHHLAKLENAGRRVNLERLIGQVMDGITDFPANLSLADQGRFAIGYYHQMQDFFTRKSE
jgi:CRISPR-associated protein Csd1